MFLSNKQQFPPNNGAIMINATIIKAVMLSAAEAELGALFLDAKEGVYLRQILTKMGHPQPRTPTQTNNTTAEGVINNKIQSKQIKAMDMRFILALRPRSSRAIPNLLAPGKDQLSGLLHKASSTGTPC